MPKTDMITATAAPLARPATTEPASARPKWSSPLATRVTVDPEPRPSLIVRSIFSSA